MSDKKLGYIIIKLNGWEKGETSFDELGGNVRAKRYKYVANGFQIQLCGLGYQTQILALIAWKLCRPNTANIDGDYQNYIQV